jgi:hypothetical protein
MEKTRRQSVGNIMGEDVSECPPKNEYRIEEGKSKFQIPSLQHDHQYMAASLIFATTIMMSGIINVSLHKSTMSRGW